MLAYETYGPEGVNNILKTAFLEWKQKCILKNKINYYHKRVYLLFKTAL
jgi:hypothetical protein